MQDTLELMVRHGGFDAIVFCGFGENGLARHMMEIGAFGKTSPIAEICAAVRYIEDEVQKAISRYLREVRLPVSASARPPGWPRRSPVRWSSGTPAEGYPTLPTPERGVRGLWHFDDYWKRRLRPEKP